MPFADTINPTNEIPNPKTIRLPDKLRIKAIPNKIIAMPNNIVFIFYTPSHYKNNIFPTTSKNPIFALYIL